MESHSKEKDERLMKRIAKEFLEERLGIEATDKNISLLADHIHQFEKAVARHATGLKKMHVSWLRSVPKQRVPGCARRWA